MSRNLTERDLAERELQVAGAIHQRVTGGEALRVPGVAVTGHAQAAGAIGGDWWTCEALPDGRVLIAVGDVTGHDLAAALIASMARGVLTGAVASIGAFATPARLMTSLGAAIAGLGAIAREMTCCVLILDPRLGHLDVASAGHPFPFLRRADGSLDVVVARGAPLSSRRAAFGVARVAIAPGDMIVISTDGVADRAGHGGQRFGERRMRRILAEHTRDAGTNVHRLRADIVRALRGFAAATEADDDLTVVVCEYCERVDAGGVVSRAFDDGGLDDEALAAAIDAAIDDPVDTVDHEMTEPMARRPPTWRTA